VTTILQLTDLHLFADKGTLLKGIDPWQSLARVLETIRSRQIEFDHLLLTGDLTHDGKPETYEQLREALGPWAQVAQAIPGNHDDRHHLGQVFNVPNSDESWLDDRVTFSFTAGDWRIFALDTLVPGELRGELEAQQLIWLERQLVVHREVPTVIFLHHPPVKVGSAWLDRIGLSNREFFCRLIELSSQVKLICCGHVHQEFQARIGGATVLAAPSTSVQFKPGTETLEVDDLPPGMRVIRLQGDAFETQVIRAAR
jgi:Icc protein